ncbi:MAG: 4Fe-4S dicluster domain-containing protein, partial [Chloroflexia bacterium]|nr:4Fe-4S dicluster domain-containing protein [Chloroflexia bacterium]
MKDWDACFHCGNCTATCPLSEEGVLFPRKKIRAMQMGLKDTLASGVEPWLCYYCGDCSKECPRDANPGELMMSLRRYLTSVYDWTGLSKLIYTSKAAELALIFLFAALVFVLSIIYSGVPDQSLWLTAEGGVAINNFFPVEYVHFGDIVMAGLLAALLITNILNMYFKVIVKPKVRAPISSYFTEFFTLIWNFATQQKFKKCDSKPYWFIHLFLVSGYVALFIIVVFFLEWFQTDTIHAWYHPQRLLGYYATVGLFAGTIYFIIRRRRKLQQNNKYSHYTDWTFVIMLFLTTLTGILMHIFRVNGLALATYYTY